MPDAFTALTLSPIGSPPLSFRGTDGKVHVAYDLQLTNATKEPASLDRLDVVDGQDPSRVVASFGGTALVDTGCPHGDCNRLRGLPSVNVVTNVIPPQETRVVFIDFTVDSLEDVPASLLHHLTGTGVA